jgi:hypothetical protein
MYFQRLAIAAFVLIGAEVCLLSEALGQSPAVVRRPSSQPGTARLSPAAALIYRYVHMQRPGEGAWARVPWLVDLPEAIQAAKAENRPILIWATDDDPLDRC